MKIMVTGAMGYAGFSAEICAPRRSAKKRNSAVLGVSPIEFAEQEDIA